MGLTAITTAMLILVTVATLLGFPIPPFMGNGLALISNYASVTGNMGTVIEINNAGYLLTGLIHAQKALVIMDILAEKGSRMAVSDVGVGVQFIRTALTGAVMNVWINTKSMKDREKAEELNRQADEMMRSGTAAADAVYQKVENALR